MMLNGILYQRNGILHGAWFLRIKTCLTFPIHLIFSKNIVFYKINVPTIVIGGNVHC